MMDKAQRHKVRILLETDVVVHRVMALGSDAAAAGDSQRRPTDTSLRSRFRFQRGLSR